MAAVDSASFLIHELARNVSRYRNYLAVIGLFYCGRLGYAVGRRVYGAVRIHLVSRVFKTNFRHYGEWALIFNCSDELTKEYATQLAARGLNIFLVGPDLFQLKSIDTEIKQLYDVETRIIQVDLEDEVQACLVEQISTLEIGILINNIGAVQSESTTDFDNASVGELKRTVNVRLLSTIMLTRLVLPAMLRRERGLIVNISSLEAFHRLRSAVFFSTTLSVDQFTESLANQYELRGITVQSLHPWIIRKTTTQEEGNSFMRSVIFPDAKTFVTSALCTAGYSKRTTGYWSHSVLSYIIDFVPERLLKSLVN